MAKVCEIRDYWNKIAPFSLKMDFDNVGFLAGFSQKEVKKALCALDITEEVIEEARAWGAELIVSHHPLLFSAKTVTDEDLTGKKLCALLSAGISAICLHTNLDAASDGVNDALLAALGAQCDGILAEETTDAFGRACGIGRFGTLPESMSMTEFLPKVKVALAGNGLRFHDAGKSVKKLAVLGGSGGEYIPEVLAAGCDTFVTADIKYDRFLEAKALGLNLIDGDHFCTENVVVPVILQRMQEAFPEIACKISAVHKQTAQFF